MMLTGQSNAQSNLDEVVIVKSSNNSYFDLSITTLVSHVDTSLPIRVILASELDSENTESAAERLFVTLGQTAMEVVDKLVDTDKSINAYLTHEQFLKHRHQIQTAVLLDQPLWRYFAFCKLILNPSNIGLITEQPILLDSTLSGLLNNLNITLNQYRLNTNNKLLPVLRNLMRRNDALLMLPRQSIYNRDSLKGVLLTSYRNRKPAISYSPAHVKSGALASIYSSPVDIGRHLSILVNQKLHNPSHQQTLVHFAKFYSIATNSKVARALGIRLPSDLELRSKLDGLAR